jgi:serine/threonine protein kinase
MAIAPGEDVIGFSGTYHVEAQHGAGSFGITYRARSARDGAQVIVKELRVEKLDDWKALELFEREGRVLASISHPNIPAFRDFFAHGAPAPLPVTAMSSYRGPEHLSLVLVQELIAGATLQQRIDAGQRLVPDEAEAILAALLHALQYLHERAPPLVHRDIKPGNVILTPDGRPYLVDFGAIQDRIRSAGSVGSTIVGTLGYMPLEQIRGDARPASDLYALGVTIAVALAGRPLSEIPFDDATGKLSLGHALPPATPAALRDALDAMIAPLLGQRAGSARDVLGRMEARRQPPASTPTIRPPAVAAPPRILPRETPRQEPRGPLDDAANDYELATLRKSLGARSWLQMFARKPGSPSPLFYLGIFGAPVAAVVVFLATRPNVFDGAKAQFSKQFTCPLERIAEHERPDLHSSDLASPPMATPPPDIAADPARLAVWKANQPKPVKDNGDDIIELEGCGHHILWACRAGQKLVSCGYQRDLAATPPSALVPRGTSTVPLPPPADLAQGPVTVTWSGHLDSSTGAAPPVGAACTLTAIAVSRGGRAQQDRLTFQCQGEMLYDSSAPLSGMSDSMFDLVETVDGDEPLTFSYELGAKDIGPRSPPRAQIMVFTPRRELDAWRDTTSPFRVHATMDVDSAERPGKPVRADTAPAFDEVVTRAARVISKTGAPPFTAPVCLLRISPRRTLEKDCRVRLECGGHVIYGADNSGFDDCVITGRQPQGFVDPAPTPKDGDPELTCDLVAETATLADTSAAGESYSVTFALSAWKGDAGTR